MLRPNSRLNSVAPQNLANVNEMLRHAKCLKCLGACVQLRCEPVVWQIPCAARCWIKILAGHCWHRMQARNGLINSTGVKRKKGREKARKGTVHSLAVHAHSLPDATPSSSKDSHRDWEGFILQMFADIRMKSNEILSLHTVRGIFNFCLFLLNLRSELNKTP